MGTISSGVGVYSGMDYASLVDQLIAIDAAPRDLLEQRVSKIDAQKTAFLDISARVTAMLSRVSTLSNSDLFNGVKTTSSNAAVMSGTSTAGVQPGNYTFRVRSLAQTHQLVSGGFRSTTTTLGTGAISIESAQARVNNQTLLESLNGYDGVDRGSFRLIDGEGRSADVDITDARSLDDVIDRINAAGLNITAELAGDAIALTETTGGNIEVREVDGGRTAATLGFDPSRRAGTGALTGANLMYLSEDSPLEAIKDGLGINRARSGGDFTVNLGAHEVQVNLTDYLSLETRLERLNHGQGVEGGVIKVSLRNGDDYEVDLSDARTIQDVKDAIESGTNGKVSIIVSGNGLRLTDGTSPIDPDDPDRNPFSISDVSGNAARDLGLTETASAARINGRDVLHMDTVSDVLAAINFARTNFTDSAPDAPLIAASLSEDGQSIELRATGAGDPTTFELAAGNSTALSDLGLTAGVYEPGDVVAGKRISSGVNTVLLSTLDGGQGVAGGSFTVESAGQLVTIDASGAETLRDVIELINAHSDTLKLEAGYDNTGTRLQLRRTADNTGAVSIADIGDDGLAAALGVAGDHAADESIRGANLQKQYLNGRTKLSALNGGQGVGGGSIKITDSVGATTKINLSSGYDTLDDVIKAINDDQRVKVTASLNETGDGLLIVDDAGGSGALTIANDGGTIGSDLNIVGEAVDGRIDGSFEFSFELDGSHSLADLAAAINERSSIASAAILNDGSGVAPYRLSISSSASGLSGELIIDGLDAGIDFNTLAKAQDASITYGDSASGGMLITSSDNSFEDVIDGLDLNVASLSDEAVTISIARDYESITKAMSGLVTDFNAFVDQVDKYGDFDPETEKSGPLQGDSTLYAVENRLWDVLIGNPNDASGEITRLSQVGITTDGTGKLTFDEQKFRDAFAANSQAVIDFFTDETFGRAEYMKEQIESITDSTDGLIANRNDALSEQQDLLNERIEDMSILLESKRQRLTNQFISMEQTLAQLQSQQNALASMSISASSA